MLITCPDPKTIHTVIFDFDGVFTDNFIYIDETGQESTRCSRGDGYALDLVRRYNIKHQVEIKYFILSTEKNPVVSQRAKKLQLECVQGVSDKLSYLKDYFQARHPEVADPFAGVIYLGNDLNDLSVMQAVGFTVAPADAHPRIQAVASLVLSERGGHGFVRAFVEKFLQLDRLSTGELNEFISHR